MSSATEAMLVMLYGRPGCCLCDEARDTLERLRGELGFELRERDITTDDALHMAYLERIPVVVVGDETVSELVFDEAAVRAALGAGNAESRKSAQRADKQGHSPPV